MTFKPTKCWINASSDGHVLSSPDGTLAGVLTKNTPNALIVPLVPGMEAVVRAHLAAKPKPAKKCKTLDPEPDCRKCHGTGGVRVRANTVSGYDTDTCECIVKQWAPKPAKKPAKKGAKK